MKGQKTLACSMQIFIFQITIAVYKQYSAYILTCSKKTRHKRTRDEEKMSNFTPLFYPLFYFPILLTYFTYPFPSIFPLPPYFQPPISLTCFDPFFTLLYFAPLFYSSIQTALFYLSILPPHFTPLIQPIIVPYYFTPF